MIEEFLYMSIRFLADFLPLSGEAMWRFSEHYYAVPSPTPTMAATMFLSQVLVLAFFLRKNWQKATFPDAAMKLWNSILLIFTPFALGGYFIHRYLLSFSIDPRVLAWMLLITGSLVLLFFKKQPPSEENASWSELLSPKAIGLLAVIQFIAPFGGFSYMALILCTLMLFRWPLRSAFYFTLLLMLPTQFFKAVFVLLDMNVLSESLSFSWPFLLTALLLIIVGPTVLRLLLSMLKRKTFYLWSYVMIGLACVVLYKTSRAPFVDQSKQDHRYQEQVMGTMASVIIWGEDSQEHAIEVMNILKSVDRALSTYKPESEVSRLNRSQGAEFKCSDFLWDNLVASKRAWVLSKGAFDPSIRPLMKVWNFREKRLKLPVQEVIDRAKALIGFEKIQLNDKTKTVMLPAGMKLDFGAIGKGYAVDLAMNYLKQQGVQRALIDLGGNMACLGTPPPEHKSYRLGVRHPVKEKGVMAEVKLLDQAIATSGNYHQYHIIDGQRYAHIIDPRTGWPVQKMDSVTIVSPSATLCDALSTAIYVAGPSLLPEIEKHYPDVHVLIVQVQQDGSLKKWSLGALFTEVAE